MTRALLGDKVWAVDVYHVGDRIKTYGIGMIYDI